MKLDSKINVQPPPYSDNSGQVITPDAIETDELEVVYGDDPKRKTVNVTITHFPLPITLLSGDAYKEWTKADLESKLKDILGSNPSGVLRSLFPKTMEEDPNGPGTQLSRMIKSLGIHMSDSCSCRRHAINMNETGNDWCAANVDTVVGWLREESQRRGLPFVDMVGNVMVNRAITQSRKLLSKSPLPQNDAYCDKK